MFLGENIAIEAGDWFHTEGINQVSKYMKDIESQFSYHQKMELQIWKIKMNSIVFSYN
jgi:hypothetical protein